MPNSHMDFPYQCVIFTYISHIFIYIYIYFDRDLISLSNFCCTKMTLKSLRIQTKPQALTM